MHTLCIIKVEIGKADREVTWTEITATDVAELLGKFNSLECKSMQIYSCNPFQLLLLLLILLLLVLVLLLDVLLYHPLEDNVWWIKLSQKHFHIGIAMHKNKYKKDFFLKNPFFNETQMNVMKQEKSHNNKRKFYNNLLLVMNVHVKNVNLCKNWRSRTILVLQNKQSFPVVQKTILVYILPFLVKLVTQICACVKKRMVSNW